MRGSFSIIFIRDLKSPYGYKIQLVFKIGLHQKDQALLEMIKAYFGGVGNINKQDKDSIQYKITSVKDLAVIINHFDKYPLITQKRADYILFKQAFELISCKEHLTNEGFHKVLAIKASINKGLSDKLKCSFPGVVPGSRPIVKLPQNIEPHWLAGFASAEGSFMVIRKKSSTYKLGFQVYLKFQITQHNRDKELLKSLVGYLGCGCYESSKGRD